MGCSPLRPSLCLVANQTSILNIQLCILFIEYSSKESIKHIRGKYINKGRKTEKLALVLHRLGETKGIFHTMHVHQSLGIDKGLRVLR